MGIKGCTRDEHWMLYGNVELLYCAPELILHCILTSWSLNINLKKMKKMAGVNSALGYEFNTT